MRVLLDTNILLDVLLQRSPWVDDSARVWRAADDGRFDGCIAAVSPPNIFYIVRRLHDATRARECVKICLEAFDVLTLDDATMRAGFDLNGSDFEDDLHIASASSSAVDVIVTRNLVHFSSAPIPAMTPANLLAKLASSAPQP